MFRQQSGQNRKVSHRILRIGTGIMIGDVDRRVLAKIFFEVTPRARHDPVARIYSRKISAEDKPRERKSKDVATGWAPSSVEVDLRRVGTPDENAVVRRECSDRYRPVWDDARHEAKDRHSKTDKQRP